MEKILALIAVSLGKKATVYAVGRVSTNDLYPKFKFRRFLKLFRQKVCGTQDVKSHDLLVEESMLSGRNIFICCDVQLRKNCSNCLQVMCDSSSATT